MKKILFFALAGLSTPAHGQSFSDRFKLDLAVTDCRREGVAPKTVEVCRATAKPLNYQGWEVVKGEYTFDRQGNLIKITLYNR